MKNTIVNMFIECPICPVIVQNAKEYVLNTKFFFSPDFVKKRYHKHFGYSLVLTFFTIWFLFSFTYLGDTGSYFQFLLADLELLPLIGLENGIMLNIIMRLGMMLISIWVVMVVLLEQYYFY
jgi:hypothetical protein